MQYFVYILASRTRVLYVGVTNDIEKRLAQHATGEGGFARKYRVSRLVFLESTSDVIAAIAREKQLKRWSRTKKVALIESLNPEWMDLVTGRGEDQIPRLADARSGRQSSYEHWPRDPVPTIFLPAF